MTRRIPTAAAVFAVIAIAACGRGKGPVFGPAPTPNVVFLVGDGFGVGAWTLAHEAARARGVSLAMDAAPSVGFLETRASDERVTDSAAAATAWSIGRLAPRFEVGGGIATGEGDAPSAPAPGALLFEALRAAKRPHGFVTTTRVTHATPAPFYARAAHRDDEDVIAADLVRAAPDVAIGGGLQHFLPKGKGGSRADERDLLAAAESSGTRVVRTWTANLPEGGPLLALLAPSHLAHELDRDDTDEPDLADMAVAAIRRLDAKGAPWFLLVEEGQIDRAAHDDDAAGVVADGLRLDRAVGAILKAVDLKRTLVVVAADHSTANPAILEGAHPESLEVVGASVEALETKVFASGPWIGTPRALESFAVPTLDEGARHTGIVAEDLDRLLSMTTRDDRKTALGSILSRRFGIVFLPLEDHVRSTGVHGHTADLVPIRAWGPRAEELRGVRDHASLGRWLREVMGLTRPDAPAQSTLTTRVVADRSPAVNRTK